MSEKFRKDLTQGSVTKQLLKFSVPFLLSNLLQALYSVADMVIVGQFCGKSGITGVSIGGQINILVTGAALGLAIGGTVLIAQYGGAKNTMIKEHDRHNDYALYYSQRSAHRRYGSAHKADTAPAQNAGQRI